MASLTIGRPLVRAAFRLEILTVAWMTIEAIVAIVAGVTAGSLTVTAFGLDSVIELGSAAVLIWRLSAELHHDRAFPEAIEHRASRIAGGLLFALAAYIIVAVAWRLWILWRLSRCCGSCCGRHAMRGRARCAAEHLVLHGWEGSAPYALK